MPSTCGGWTLTMEEKVCFRSAHFDIIDGSDHFYSRQTRQLEEILGRHI